MKSNDGSNLYCEGGDRPRERNLLKLTFAACIGLLPIWSALPSPCHAQVQSNWVTSDPEVLKEARAMTGRLDRNIVVYNWGSRAELGLPKSGEIDMADPSVKETVRRHLLARLENRFLNLDLPVSGRAQTGGAMAPNGLYLATEPVISRSYGGPGNGFVMTKLTLEKNTLYIDGRYRRPPLGPNLIRALNERGCTNPNNATGRFTARDLIKSDNSQRECRQALVDIVQALGVDAILYIFKSEPVPFCKRVFPWNAAFVLIRDKYADLAENYVDHNSSEAEQAGDLAAVNGVFLSSGVKNVPFPGVTPLLGPQLQSYMANNYFACHPGLREF